MFVGGGPSVLFTFFFKVFQSNPELTDLASFANQLAPRAPVYLLK